MKFSISLFFIFYLLSSNLLFKGIISGGNEYDVLIVAKHFMNPNWIKGDWYLNQGFPYRNLFNVIAVSLALFLPLNLVSVVGRLLTICFFTHILFLFKNLFKISKLSKKNTFLKNNNLREVFKWIAKNTPKEDTLFANPYYSSVYYYTQRPVFFFSIKHSPSSPKYFYRVI